MRSMSLPAAELGVQLLSSVMRSSASQANCRKLKTGKGILASDSLRHPHDEQESHRGEARSGASASDAAMRPKRHRLDAPWLADARALERATPEPIYSHVCEPVLPARSRAQRAEHALPSTHRYLRKRLNRSAYTHRRRRK